MEIIRIASIAIIGTLISLFLKKIDKSISIMVAIASALIIIISVLDDLKSILIYLKDVYNHVTYGKDYLIIVFKIIAIAYVTDFTAQLCKDAGENAICAKVEMAGKIIIFYMALPILITILELIDSLLA